MRDVCVDDAIRLAYVEILSDEKVKGSAYRSAAHSLACRALGIRHIRTQPYRPRTTARPSASRTVLREWAYAAVCGCPEVNAGPPSWSRACLRVPQL